MKRFKFEPFNFNTIETFNGSLVETRIMYYLQHQFDSSEERLSVLGYLHSPHASYLHGFLMATGAYHGLWIGDLDGVIAPMDVQPTGWTYPNGEPLEPSWFWQWNPSEFSKTKLLEDTQKINPFQSQGRFKSLTPMKMADQYGEIKQIEAIPVMRLSAIMRSCTWTIEIN